MKLKEHFKELVKSSMAVKTKNLEERRRTESMFEFVFNAGALSFCMALIQDPQPQDALLHVSREAARVCGEKGKKVDDIKQLQRDLTRDMATALFNCLTSEYHDMQGEGAALELLKSADKTKGES